MNVLLNDSHVGGSPYELRVGVDSNPAKVVFNFDDVKTGILGQELKTLIDTSAAGPGELTASCVGAVQPAHCKFEDKNNGIYLLTIMPQEVGRHLLQIKYNDQPISEGPFQVRVFGPPDAAKVT